MASTSIFDSPDRGRYDFRMRSTSINVHMVEDEVEDSQEMLESYFKRFVLRRYEKLIPGIRFVL